MESLWGEEFTVESTKSTVKKISKKINQPKTPTITIQKQLSSKKLKPEEKLPVIAAEVERILGSYKTNTCVIKDYDTFEAYIDKSIQKGFIAIDTETNNSLDPITCKIMGLCIYTPGEYNAYIPVNHTDLNHIRYDWQVTEDQIKEQLGRLSNTKIIMHNGKFDYQVIKCTCGIALDIYWDTMIGAKLLDENEYTAGLKSQYIEKIDPSIEKYDIGHLFEGVEYCIVDPEIFALYAATDAYMTYKLYEWQNNAFQLPKNESLNNLFHNLEMPLVHVLAEMELNGMEVDQDYAKRLSLTYHNQLDKIDSSIKAELDKIKDGIAKWRLTPEANFKPNKKTGEGLGKSKNEQLPEEINLASPTQLAILFYDVLKCPSVSKKSPRGTGEKELEALFEKKQLPLCKLILQRREVVKLLSTYIDVIPELAKRWPDGRVRTHFNQYGAATGRLSSSDPINFQNIPSHEKRIRMLFKAKDGNMIIGSDYSAQEPRLTAFYSQDPAMIKAYEEGKDLYAVIGSKSFDISYEESLEFYPEGTEIEIDGQKVICGNKTHQNKSGKEYRGMAKSILLGVLYGRGAASVGEQIHKSREEAQKIIDDFYNAFPDVKRWIDESVQSAHKIGYVEDIIGRRRRLPDALLDRYEITDNRKTFNPLLFTKGISPTTALVESYKNKCYRARNKLEYEQIKSSAEKEGITIKDNTGFIAQAERQAVNARVQGGAATLTKNALIEIYNNEELRRLGAFLINSVHDEILMEAPKENAEKVAKILTEVMINSAKKYVTNVPMKCDAYIVPCWYFDEYCNIIKTEKMKKIKEGLTEEEISLYLYDKYSESTKEQIDYILNM